jgi:hypothetical protein
LYFHFVYPLVFLFFCSAIYLQGKIPKWHSVTNHHQIGVGPKVVDHDEVRWAETDWGTCVFGPAKLQSRFLYNCPQVWSSPLRFWLCWNHWLWDVWYASGSQYSYDLKQINPRLSLGSGHNPEKDSPFPKSETVVSDQPGSQIAHFFDSCQRCGNLYDAVQWVCATPTMTPNT